MTDWASYGMRPTKELLRDSSKNKNYWAKQADGLWGRIIHRMMPSCAFAHIPRVGECKMRNEAHHLISRQIREHRHTIENGVVLCGWHHKYSPVCSPHMGPLGYVEALQEHRPAQWEWYMNHRHSFSKNYSYRDNVLKLLDIEQALNLGLFAVWRNGSIVLE